MEDKYPVLLILREVECTYTKNDSLPLFFSASFGTFPLFHGLLVGDSMTALEGLVFLFLFCLLPFTPLFFKIWCIWLEKHSSTRTWWLGQNQRSMDNTTQIHTHMPGKECWELELAGMLSLFFSLVFCFLIHSFPFPFCLSFLLLL